MQENEIDFEALIQLSTAKNQSKSKEMPKWPRNFISSPIPLAIGDIPYILFGDSIKEPKSIYGLSFRTVMLYGRAVLFRTKEDFTLYKVDDGTGSVVVKYANDRVLEAGNYCRIKTFRCLLFEFFLSHTLFDPYILFFSDLQKCFDQLDEEVVLAGTQGIQLFENNFNRKSKKCLDHLDNISSLVKLIKRRKNCNSKVNTVMQTSIGAKVAIMGSPYRYKDTIGIYAYCMQVDNKKSRNMEINFKRNLAQWYQNKYGRYSRDGMVNYQL